MNPAEDQVLRQISRKQDCLLELLVDELKENHLKTRKQFLEGYNYTELRHLDGIDLVKKLEQFEVLKRPVCENGCLIEPVIGEGEAVWCCNHQVSNLFESSIFDKLQLSIGQIMDVIFRICNGEKEKSIKASTKIPLWKLRPLWQLFEKAKVPKSVLKPEGKSEGFFRQNDLSKNRRKLRKLK